MIGPLPSGSKRLFCYTSCTIWEESICYDLRCLPPGNIIIRPEVGTLLVVARLAFPAAEVAAHHSLSTGRKDGCRAHRRRTVRWACPRLLLLIGTVRPASPKVTQSQLFGERHFYRLLEIRRYEWNVEATVSLTNRAEVTRVRWKPWLCIAM